MNNYFNNQFMQSPYVNPPINYGPRMPRQAPQQNQFVPFTNKRFVSSLEEAMSIQADFNSEMVYFDQNKDVLYNICTDGRGQKSYTIVDLALHKEEHVNASTNVNLDELSKKVEELNNKVEDLYGKYNAKQTDNAAARNDGTASSSGSTTSDAKQS